MAAEPALPWPSFHESVTLSSATSMSTSPSGMGISTPSPARKLTSPRIIACWDMALSPVSRAEGPVSTAAQAEPCQPTARVLAGQPGRHNAVHEENLEGPGGGARGGAAHRGIARVRAVVPARGRLAQRRGADGFALARD